MKVTIGKNNRVHIIESEEDIISIVDKVKKQIQDKVGKQLNWSKLDKTGPEEYRCRSSEFNLCDILRVYAVIYMDGEDFGRAFMTTVYNQREIPIGDIESGDVHLSV